MAVFFDHPLDVNLEGAFTHTVWHPKDQMLAVGILFDDDSGGGVFIFNEVGELVEIDPLKRSYCVCFRMAPNKTYFGYSMEGQ